MRPDDDSTPADAGTPSAPQHAARPAEQPPDPVAGGSSGGPESGPNSGPRHAAPDDAGPRPLIDLSRDPTPGVPNHAAPDDAEDAD
ncbi:MAG TPA: hypothetical protein VFX70_03080 [Mycobacteriales bacterium]|nr:hypothetical protein [Mycobacteriales bacterium]